MATSITGIVFNTDYNNTVKFIIFAPNTFASVDVEWTVPTGSFNQTVNVDLQSTSGGFQTYGVYGKTTYDSYLDGFAVWSGTFDINEDYSGVVRAKLNGESDWYTANFVSRGNKEQAYNGTDTYPQGMTITFNECSNGQTQAYGNMELKVFDNYSYISAQAARYKQMTPSIGSLISPLYIAASTDTGGNTGNWIESSPSNLATADNNSGVGGTMSAIFDLGLLTVGETITFRAIGADGEGASDYLEESFLVSCNFTDSNGTGTEAQQTENSNYTIPAPTSTTGCLPTGLRVVSIVSGSTLEIDGTEYNVGDIIPMSELTLNGSNYEGLYEVTTNSTALGTGTGATFVWTSGCGDSDGFIVTRTVVTNCVDVSSGIITGNLNVTSNIQETYTVTHNGTTPYNYVWTVTGGTLDSGQGTNTIVITPETDPVNISVVITNCEGSGNYTTSIELNVAEVCVITYPIKTCYTLSSITGTLAETIESDRVTNWNQTSLTFVAISGTNDYTFILTTDQGVEKTVKLLNITC